MSGKKFEKFEDFTNLYELSKTLRFELKPVKFNEKGGIEWMSQDEMKKVFKEVWDKDIQVHKNYKEAKKYFDKMHREFINEALSAAVISEGKYKKFEDIFWKNKIDRKKYSKEFRNVAMELRAEVAATFDKQADAWRENYLKEIEDEKDLKSLNHEKNKGINFFFKEDIFNFLKKKYPEAILINEKGEQEDIFSHFNRFSTYFSKFHETRNNFYKIDGTATAIPTRVIDVNLPFFLENRQKFDKNREKLSNLLNQEQKDIFGLKHFNKCLSQKQINEYNKIIGDINSEINKSEPAKQLKFKTLYKQILGEKDEEEAFIEIKNDDEVFSVLADFINKAEGGNKQIKELIFDFYKDQLNGEGRYNLEKIYFSKGSLNTMSNKWFIRWDLVRNAFLDSKGKKKTNKEIPDFVSLADIKKALDEAVKVCGLKNVFRENYVKQLDEKRSPFDNFLRIYQFEFDNLFCGSSEDAAGYDKNLEALRRMMEKEKKYTNRKEKNKNGEDVYIQNQKIKDYADSALAISSMAKYFALEKKGRPVSDYDRDEYFYNKFDEYGADENVFKYFDALRNYLTKKSYKKDKVKINFDKGTLMGGWSAGENGDLQYGTAILRDEGKYFLAILKSGSAFNDKQEGLRAVPGGSVELMGYEQLKSQTIFGTSYSGKYGAKWADDKLKLSDKELILRAKDILNKYKEIYPEVEGLLELKTDNAKEFIKELNETTLYRLSFESISKRYVADNIDKKFNLFEIYNKDFSLSKGERSDGSRENIHSIYFKNIFSGAGKIKLSGGGEIFFRETADLKDKKERIVGRKKRKVEESKRYFSNKFFLHLPIVLNNGAGKKYFKEFNAGIKEFLIGNNEINIIGIDRGERNLAYYSVVNQKGDILEQGSLNKFGTADYFEKLDEIEKRRDKARKSWQEIEKIKEMKDGYISHVVRKLYKLMLDYGAIVVFENLNAGFKRGRFKIEKQVYQKLELALATKLNYLVLKDKSADEKGGVLNAYQLTPLIQNFSDMENSKQFGAIFYIPASFTSAVCPVCGFRKSFSLPVETKNKDKGLVEKFDIKYNSEKERFAFNCLKSSFFEEKNKKTDKKEEGFKVFRDVKIIDDIKFYSDVERVIHERSEDGRKVLAKEFDATADLKNIFKENGIRIDSDVTAQIKERDLPGNFYERMLKNINIILKIRNTKKEKDENGFEVKEDFLNCPVCGFNTRNDKKLLALPGRYKGKEKFEFNGDANGAYNIARKGAIVLQKINEYPNDLIDMSNQDLTVYQEEWDKYLQEQK